MAIGGVSMGTAARASGRGRAGDVVVAALLAVIVAAAVAARLPGVEWMIGYGHAPDQSFNWDDSRFVTSAKAFELWDRKPDGYPLFMTAQLYVVAKGLAAVTGDDVNYLLVLRWISMAYAVAGILFCYLFCRVRGLPRPVAVLAAFFLAFAPLHVVQSHFGMPDVSLLPLFYGTVLAAWLYVRGGPVGWLHACVIGAALSMADKFFLPALIPPVLALLVPGGRPPWERGFLAACVFTAVFCAANFFNYTPWDFQRLVRMLAFDNVMVSGGIPPWRQAALYAWDLIPASGVVTSAFALAGLAVVGVRARMRRPPQPLRLGRWLRHPEAVLVLPLLAHVALIVMAQVHFMRHVTVLIPVVCVLAAIGVVALAERLRGAPPAVRVAGLAAVAALLGGQAASATLVERAYPGDIRKPVWRFVNEQNPGLRATTFSVYTEMGGVERIDGLPESPLFVTCDMDYQRYLDATDARAVFHAWGGQARLAFFHDLFAGRTPYRAALSVERERHGLEDRLAGLGVLPELGLVVPNRCVVFRRQDTIGPNG